MHSMQGMSAGHAPSRSIHYSPHSHQYSHIY